MKKILYIPIKYESERVPGKNFKLLAGKPLYSYIFHTIKESEFFDDVFIDFDSKMARSNVELPKEFNYYFRPERLLGNDISSNELLRYFSVSILKENCAIFQCHVTSPFLKPSTIQAVWDIYKRSNARSVFTVEAIKDRFYFNPGKEINHDFQNLTKTQDLVPVYRENSLLYCFERDWFLKSGVRINETSQFWPISGKENIDIDTMEDWYLAEAVAQYEN